MVFPHDSNSNPLAVGATPGHNLSDNTFVLIGLLTPDGTIVDVNEPILTATKARADELKGRALTDVDVFSFGRETSSSIRVVLARAARGRSRRCELKIVLRDSRRLYIDCMISPLRGPAGRVEFLLFSGVEITARKRAEASLLRLNRELRMLSACGQVLVRAAEEATLLNDVCRILIERGRYLLAWVGIPEDDAEKSVRCVARAGPASEYVDLARVSWAPDHYGEGPIGRALRERKTQINRNFSSDPTVRPWRDIARRFRFASSIALPLLSGTRSLGALCIYSSSKDAFDVPETGLLGALAADLAYGMEVLRMRSEGRRFRSLLDHANDIIYAADGETGRILDANEAVSRLLGYTLGEFHGMCVPDFSVAAAARSWSENVTDLRRTGSLTIKGQYRTKHGDLIPVEVSMRHVQRDGKSYIIALTRDLSEQNRQALRIARVTRAARMHGSLNGAVLRIRERDALMREVCNLAVRMGGYERVIWWLIDTKTRTAVAQYRAGVGPDASSSPRVAIGDASEGETTVSGSAFDTAQIVAYSDLTTAGIPEAMLNEMLALGFRSLIVLPLILDGRRFGIVTMWSRNAVVLQEEEIALLQDISATLAYALRVPEHPQAAPALAYFDPLTGLPTRARFCELTDSMFRENAISVGDTEIVVFDVRDLANLNDTYGRHFGDLVLQEVAHRLRFQHASDERIGCLGAGTFVFVALRASGSDAPASSVLEGGIFGEPFCILDRTLRLSYSSGVAHFPSDGSNAASLLERAEAALRKAKESGEQYLHYRLEIHGEFAARFELENKLRTAMAEKQFEVYYQPLVKLATDTVNAAEALLRWRDPDNGLVSPAAFMPVLELSGAITSVGNWVLERIVEDCERWAILQLPPVRIAANISAVQLRRRSFAQEFLKHQRRLAMLPGYGFDVEITETALLQDLDGAVRHLNEIRAAGVRVALDDFGTGYSSLGILSKLPIDILKIDRVFISGLPNEKSAMLVESIVRLATAFELEIVAEGVETEEQLRTVRATGCHVSQGYLHSRPLTAREFEVLLAGSS